MDIAFFTKGLDSYYAHIKPFIDFDKNLMNKYYVFHLENIYNTKTKVTDNRVTFIDISKGLLFIKKLKRIKLDLIVHQDSNHIFNLFLIFIAKSLQIKSIFFQHGLKIDFFSFNPKTFIKSKLKINKLLFSFKKYLFFYSFIFVNFFFVQKKN